MTETTSSEITPVTIDTTSTNTSTSDGHLLYGTIWLFSQLFGGAASYIVYSKEYKYWMNLNNPNGYSSGWNMWVTGWR